MIYTLCGLRLSIAILLSLMYSLVLVVTPVFAHDGVPLTPYDLARAWKWDSFLMVGLLSLAWLYSRGVKTLWWRSGACHGVTTWQAFAFNSGLTVLFVALVSPLQALSNALFSAHMVQHLLLVLIAAPLLVVGGAPQALVWAIPQSWRRQFRYWWGRQIDLHLIWRMLTQPRITWAVHVAMLWVWQTPYVFKVALQDQVIHALQHGTLLGAALLFWRLLLPDKQRSGLPPHVGLRFVFTTAILCSVLGTLITFAPVPWHTRYASTALQWGLTPLADQQLAGVILWASTGLVYLGATLAFWRTWRRSGKEAMQTARQGALAESVAP